MADYLEMYKILFQALTQTINILQEAQRKTEEIYILSEQPNMKIINLQKVNTLEVESEINN